MTCPSCGKDRLAPTTTNATRTVDGVLYTARLPADRCSGCRSAFIHGPALEAFERAIATHLARLGPMGPEGLAWMRLQLGLSGKELAGLLDVTPMHLSRWENGRRPLDRGAWLLVGQLVLDRFGGAPPLVERLAALEKPPRQPVRLAIA